MKKSVIIIYILFFWVIIPAILIAGAQRLDALITLPSLFGCQTAGWIVVILSSALLVLSIIQFIRNSGVLPISAYPPKYIVRSGMYAYYRHPIYLFYITLFIGIAIVWASSSMLFVVMPIFIGIGAIYTYIEELSLLKRFGADFKAYQEQSGLLIPRFHMILATLFYLLSKLFFPIKVVNKHNIPTKAPFFIVASHRNYLDPFLIAFALPYKVHYVTTFGMFRKRLTTLFFRSLGCIPKRRYLYDSATVKEMIQALKNGSVIGIFPEGERSYSGALLELKPEPMKLFHKWRDVPILPVSVSGNYIMWPRWGQGWRRCGITVTYHPVIEVKTENTVEQIRDMISSLIRPDDTGKTTNYKKRAQRLEYLLYRCPSCGTFDSLISQDDVMHCRECGYEIFMHDDYRLQVKKNSEITTIQNVYEKIRIKQSDIMIDQIISNPIASSQYCLCFQEQGVKLIFKFAGQVSLYRESLVARPRENGSSIISIPIKDLLSATIEGNRKLQIYDNSKKQLYQFIFEHESAKKWQDYIAEAYYSVFNDYPIVR